MGFESLNPEPRHLNLEVAEGEGLTFAALTAARFGAAAASLSLGGRTRGFSSLVWASNH